jgi:hypothetical protein
MRPNTIPDPIAFSDANPPSVSKSKPLADHHASYANAHCSTHSEPQSDANCTSNPKPHPLSSTTHIDANTGTLTVTYHRSPYTNADSTSHPESKPNTDHSTISEPKPDANNTTYSQSYSCPGHSDINAYTFAISTPHGTSNSFSISYSNYDTPDTNANRTAHS